MQYTLKIVVMLLGLVFLALGFKYLIDPVGMGEQFGLQPLAGNGYATLRADMFALFGVCGLAAILGAWRNDRTLLLVSAAICLFALAGRFISYFVDGASTGMLEAVAVEVVSAATLLVASRVLPAGGEVRQQALDGE